MFKGVEDLSAVPLVKNFTPHYLRDSSSEVFVYRSILKLLTERGESLHSTIPKMLTVKSVKSWELQPI